MEDKDSDFNPGDIVIINKGASYTITVAGSIWRISDHALHPDVELSAAIMPIKGISPANNEYGYIVYKKHLSLYPATKLERILWGS